MGEDDRDDQLHIRDLAVNAYRTRIGPERDERRCDHLSCLAGQLRELTLGRLNHR